MSIHSLPLVRFSSSQTNPKTLATKTCKPYGTQSLCIKPQAVPSSYLRRSFTHWAVRAGPFSHVSWPSGPSSNQPFNALLCNSNQQMLNSLSGYWVDSIAPVHDHVGPSLCGRSGGSMKVKESVSLPCVMSKRSSGYSGEPNKFEAGKDIRNSEGFQLSKYNVDPNADIVHVKILCNNTFITVTDSKGNTKFGLSAGHLIDKKRKVKEGKVEGRKVEGWKVKGGEVKGGKVKGKKDSCYFAKACAERAGRYARHKGIKSVVVKVDGFSYFKRRKHSILGLQEGYSDCRRDKHPIVYIEDTTRRAHNGCRPRKKRCV